VNFGAKKTAADMCVYVKGSGENLSIIAVYVDDILIASKNAESIKSLKEHLRKQFDITDRGEAKYCLGMEFSVKQGEVSIGQSAYISDLLQRFGMTDCRAVSTPMALSTRADVDNDQGATNDESLPYRELVGALMYLAVCTRPDISFAVSYLSQFCQNFGRQHWVAAKRVLRYLKGTRNLGLIYRKTGKPISGYVDADWANCTKDRRSYTGYVFVLSGCPLTWESRKQRTVALSSTEAEYMALTECAKEGLHLKRFLNELGLGHLAQICIQCDNNGARKLAENPVFHGRSKHIDVRHHFVREVLRNGEFKIEYTPTHEMAADVLTKGLSAPKHMKCLEILGMPMGSILPDK